jgi:hypothetical protein
MLKCKSLPDVQPTTGYSGLLCAVTLQALQDITDCNGYSHGVDALQYLNSEPVQAMHEMIGISLRRRWTFTEAKQLRKKRGN